MDEEFVKSASFGRDVTPSQSQTHFEKRLTKKTGTVEKSIPKISTTHKPKVKLNDDEPDIDVENAPVIQGSFEGSFEITKTDADITRKRTSPTKSVTTSITPTSTKFKSKKPIIEKVTSPIYRSSDTPTTTSTSSTTITTSTTTSTTTTTPTPWNFEHIVSSSGIPPISSSSIVSFTYADSDMVSSLPSLLEDSFHRISNVQHPPKLDANLFTSSPVMDTEPWRPIRPDVILPPGFNMKPVYGAPATSLDALETGILSVNKFKISDHITKNPNDMIFYQSFTNPVFMPGTSGIEKLGSTDVKPHPLPVPLIDEAMIPPFKPLNPTTHAETQQPINISSDVDEKFEHIGGGVIVKKHEETTSTMSNSTDKIKLSESPLEVASQSTTPSNFLDKSTQMIISELTSRISEVVSSTGLEGLLQADNKIKGEQGTVLSPEMTDKLADFLLDLLDVSKDGNETQDIKKESRIEPEQNEKPSFLNIKEVVLSRNKNTNMTTNDRESAGVRNVSAVSESKTTTMVVTSTTVPSTTKRLLPVKITEPVIRNRIGSGNSTIKPDIVNRKKITIKPRPRPTSSVSVDSARTTPMTLDDSLLFPSHTKWEYVNGSSNGFISTTPMKKVFNETLQAWVVENDEKLENHSIKDLPIKRNNTEELQNISLIFDTLVSKLGISPTIPTKIPPFAAFSQNKLKQSQNNEIRNRIRTSTTMATTKITTQSPSLNLSTKARTTIKTTSVPTTKMQMLNNNSTLITTLFDRHDIIGNMSPEIIIGEAEVEVVDPTKYEEMLSSSQSISTSTSHPPTLVTLLPVRSNSGIRTFRPPIRLGNSGGGSNNSGSSTSSSTTTGNSASSESRRFVYHPKYRETVVKTGIQVTS